MPQGLPYHTLHPYLDKFDYQPEALRLRVALEAAKITSQHGSYIRIRVQFRPHFRRTDREQTLIPRVPQNQTSKTKPARLGIKSGTRIRKSRVASWKPESVGDPDNTG